MKIKAFNLKHCKPFIATTVTFASHGVFCGLRSNLIYFWLNHSFNNLAFSVHISVRDEEMKVVSLGVKPVAPPPACRQINTGCLKHLV